MPFQNILKNQHVNIDVGVWVFLPALGFSIVAMLIFFNFCWEGEKQIKPKLPAKILGREGKLT